jgi:hypothetical protein
MDRFRKKKNQGRKIKGEEDLMRNFWEENVEDGTTLSDSHL